MKHWEYHPEYVDGCFGCKGLSVQMNAGDADSRKFMTNKRHNTELDACAYRMGKVAKLATQAMQAQGRGWLKQIQYAPCLIIVAILNPKSTASTCAAIPSIPEILSI